LSGLLRVGLSPFALDADGSTAALEPLARQSELAESLGFDSVWLPESHFVERGATPAPLLLLAALAARTRTIRLGTASYLIPIRHPVQIAEEVAVLDRLSGGRVILGVGRGFRPALFQVYSVPEREKRDRFERSLGEVLRAWRGEPVPGADGTRILPSPVQKPHPPIWVAAFGPKALEQAGRLGLAYLASPVEPLDTLVENYARHREACPDPDSHAKLPVPVMRTVYVARARAEAAQVREALERESRGLLASRASRLRRSGEAGVDDWALVGDREQVLAGIERYVERIGMTHLIARISVPGSPIRAEAAIERLGALLPSTS
jgi:alkanesulfonate monooxygenase SsuD/methylene tetrahydromethanopterin reductase-like flavin-dependent oxidoreductase (luciferase family)